MKGRVALFASVLSLCLVGMVAAQVSTVEGTVVSSGGGTLVIDTSTGQQTFMTDAQSSLPMNLAVGDRIKVEFHTLANNKLHAFKVTTLTAAAPMAEAPKAPERTEPPATATTPTEPMPPAQTEPPATTTTPIEPAPAQPAEGGQLPATASPLPLLALVGGLSLAGGMLVRALRR